MKEEILKYRIFTLLALVGFFALAVGVPIGQAQTAGTITGTVTDQSGAVVPSADVAITNTGTGVVARTLQTDSSGNYVAEALPVGTYQVAIEAKGFQRSVRSGINLDVADRLDISFVLNVGAVSQTMEVTGAAPVVETQTGEQSQLISTRQIDEIPILGRNIMLLQQMVPGAAKLDGTADDMGQGFYATRGFAINGLNDHFTGYMVDGVWNTQQGNQTSPDTNPGPDMLAEFKVLTSNYSAKYGVAGGANILAVTKSGTHDFHVNLYEYVRNDKLDAADFFLNQANEAKSPLRYNDFGFTIGGPLYIPGHFNSDKSKTFFFWSEEWRRDDTAAAILAATPTSAMRSGDFSGYGPLTDPTNPQTGLPLVDNSGTPCVGGTGMTQVNPNCIDNNTALLFQQDFPQPNTSGFLNFAQGARTVQDWREDNVRIDQNITQKVRAFVRFTHDAWDEVDPITQWSSDSFPTIHSTFNVPSRNFIAKVTTVFSPTLLNEISVNYGAAYGSPKPPAMEILGAATLPAGYTAKTVFGGNVYNLVPTMTFAGGWGGIDCLWGPWWAHQGMTEYTDDLTKQFRSHSFQMGAVYLWSQAPVQSQTSPSRQGLYYFDGSLTGNPIADALLGLPASYSELQGYRQPMFNFHQFEPYFQDDYKVTRRLTVNLGIRWFYIPHVYSDQLSMFMASKYNPAQAPTVNPDGTIVPNSGNLENGIVIAGQGGVPRGLVQNHLKSFGPRVGFAWDPTGSGKTALRGGYGMGYYRIEGNDVQSMSGNPPFSKIATFFRPPFDNPAGGTAAPLTPLDLDGLDPNYDIPYAESWSLSVQRQLTSNLGLSVAYVGSTGVHRDMDANINQPLPTMGYDFDPRIACTATTPYPCTTRISPDSVRPYLGWSAINNVIPVGNSNYNALQITLQKRLSRGLSFGVDYTWSKAIASCTGLDLDGCTQNYYDMKSNRGLANFDRPQMLIANYVYDLPFFKGLSGIGGGALKGWEATGLVTLESGSAFTPGYTSGTAGLATYPDRVAGVSINNGPKTAEQWFNTAAFAAPAFGYFGDAGNGIIRGPGMNNWDMGFFKNFRIKEHGNVQFRAEMFNTWNHTNFWDMNTTYGSGSFGQVYSAHTPRVVQIALRLSF
jgi:hypothetical protein